MFAVQRHIDQNYKDHLYSEPIYVASVASGANMIASRDFGSFGAKCILISSLTLSGPLNVCVSGGVDICVFTPVTFTDISGRVLFTMQLTESMTGIYEWWKVIQEGQLFIQCNNSLVNFSIGLQYLTKREERWPEKALTDPL